MSINEKLRGIASVDLFKEVAVTDAFIGRPFYFDFSKMKVLSNDHWKERVGGIAAGAFLVAVYDNAGERPEVILLRVLGPTTLPSDSDVVAAMVDHYKENAATDASANKLDSYTRYEFQFSGLECRVLGSFYRDGNGRTMLGADVDNFYGPNNYSVYRPSGRVLEYVVNFRDGESIPGGVGDQRIGEVRYASSRRHSSTGSVPVYVSAFDYLGKRTALFGMTRTGKSNTVKMIIKATAELSPSGAQLGGKPVKPIGQIIFDVNGEYANDNQQDQGTAIYQLYAGDVTRYSILQKDGFKVMKLNFYRELPEGIEMIRANLQDDRTIYTQAFLNVTWEEPDQQDVSATTRYGRRIACYQAILRAAGFTEPKGHSVKFTGAKELNDAVGFDPKDGITLDQAVQWFTWVWDNYETNGFFENYRTSKRREWADDDLKSLMRFLTRKPSPGAQAGEAGFRKLVRLRELHTATLQRSYETEIIDLVRAGKIVIIDLSQGNPEIQRTYSDRLCGTIFREAMDRFISNEPSNFVQMYFEEAHNLFPKKNESDLTLIYNRIAKEGAKLNLGLVYATQEVSSISANVLKNTQNWFISHLNNQDELREISKYYDFEDFVESLRRTTDKGFIRMKTYSNAFIVPVQIDRFSAVRPEASVGYASKGRKPIERASKIAHVEIIKNPDVQAYVQQCVLPSAPDNESLETMLTELADADVSDVSAVIAIDGGYTETFVREEYPSACIAFFTFGPLLFQLADLRALDNKRFIAPEDLHKLKQIERYTLVIPTKGIRQSGQDSLAATVRRTIYDFFVRERGPEREQLVTSLKWFLFRRWKRTPNETLQVSIEHCPYGCGYDSISFSYSAATSQDCPGCGKVVYLTDTFRLHERVDEEMGASGIAAYVMTMLEQLVLVHLIHNILAMKPALLQNILFIKDGPLAFFGLVAPLYRPMRELVEYLLSQPSAPTNPTLRLTGLEKSGPFVEHAATIQDRMHPGSFMVLGDGYIRKHIVPSGDASVTYGQNTYYGQKVFFRSASGEMHVATIPGKAYAAEPRPEDIPHLHQILALVGELRCSMYDNALIPVALANKLVSLSDFPSQRILTTFARESVKA